MVILQREYTTTLQPGGDLKRLEQSLEHALKLFNALETP